MATAKILRNLIKGVFLLDRRMAKLTELKTLMLCICFVAVASLIALFSYTVNFTRYMKAAARAPVVLVINDTRWNRLLQEMSFYGSNEQGWNDELTYHSSAESVGRNRDQWEHNIHQNRSNINRPNYDEVTENPRKYIRGLCPEKSPTLGKFESFFMFLITSFPRLGVRKLEGFGCGFLYYILFLNGS